jgi:hypothetical protein
VQTPLGKCKKREQEMCPDTFITKTNHEGVISQQNPNMSAQFLVAKRYEPKEIKVGNSTKKKHCKGVAGGLTAVAVSGK